MKFRKKPVVIDAWKWDESETMLKELKFMGLTWCSNIGHRDRPGWVGKLYIKTLEGSMAVGAGDFIIKGVKGEFYPCKPDIFEMTYEPELDFDREVRELQAMIDAPEKP